MATIVDPRINETLQTGAVSNQRKRENETRLVGTVSNCTDAMRLETAPTGWAKVSIYNLSCYLLEIYQNM